MWFADSPGPGQHRAAVRDLGDRTPPPYRRTLNPRAICRPACEIVFPRSSAREQRATFKNGSVSVYHETTKADVSELSERFYEERFLFVPGSSLLAIEELNERFLRFAQNWASLPADPYFTGHRPNRFRRHAKFDFDADTGRLRWRPVSGGYFQALEFNPLFGGITRYFAPIERSDDAEAVISTLLRFAAGAVFALSGSWLVNVHLVRTISPRGSSTAPAPEGPHRDGYELISIHLVDRNNESGGETMILDKSGQLLHTLMLDRPMDTLYMDDRQFRHDVAPITAARRSCYRDMILMSYEPV